MERKIISPLHPPQNNDNGQGLAKDIAASILFGVGVSSKSGHDTRGFRGIGRLGGIGYCDELVFETRTRRSDSVFVATWNGTLLRDICRNAKNDVDLADTVSSIVGKCERRAGDSDPARFFRVRMKGIHRFHKDELMNVDIIQKYLIHACPVPFEKKRFPFAAIIEKHIAEIDGYRNYCIRINGEPAYKPHNQVFAISGQSFDEISDVQCFEITGRTGQCIGRGWFAKSGFKASLLQGVSMRGIRIRQGNMEVGDEYFLADLFAERRFATWVVGEVHLNYSVRLNARRDGFEQSENYESFLEQASLLCKHISGLCRSASKERSISIQAEKTVDAISDSVEKAVLLRGQHREKELKKAKEVLAKSEKSLVKDKRIAALKDGIVKLEDGSLSLSSLLDGRILRGIDQKTLLEEIAESVLEHYPLQKTASGLVKAITVPYMRKDVDIKKLWS